MVSKVRWLFANSRPYTTGGDRELVKSPYLAEKSSDFDEIWNTTAHLELDDSQRTKYF